MPSPASAPPVLCFGEILWDVLPHGRFAGGAPFNVAYHLHRQGMPVRVISAVGRDAAGDELLARVAGWGVPADTIARHASLETGYVRAEVSAAGDARYTIARPVAWDEIPVDAAHLELARTARAIVFGSLALRSPANRAALTQLIAALPVSAWRVFDVNLRAPHDDLALVAEFARGVSLLKLNAAEAARLASGADEAPGREERDARALATRFGARRVCVTAGARGAGFLLDGDWFWEDGRPVTVADTVGSGDAFLAALLRANLEGSAPAVALRRACRIGEWVATQPGATPDYERWPGERAD